MADVNATQLDNALYRLSVSFTPVGESNSAQVVCALALASIAQKMPDVLMQLGNITRELGAIESQLSRIGGER